MPHSILNSFLTSAKYMFDNAGNAIVCLVGWLVITEALSSSSVGNTMCIDQVVPAYIHRNTMGYILLGLGLALSGIVNMGFTIVNLMVNFNSNSLFGILIASYNTVSAIKRDQLRSYTKCIPIYTLLC